MIPILCMILVYNIINQILQSTLFWCCLMCSLLKGYPWWNRSFQRNWKALQSQVEAFLIDVHPIWYTTQKVMRWSRIGSRDLSCRNILVHVITLIVKVHFVIFIAVNWLRTWNTCFGTKNYILASILYTKSGTILRTLQKHALWTIDSVLISNKNLLYLVRYSILTLFGHSI